MANPFIDATIPKEEENLIEQLVRDVIYDKGVAVKWLPKTIEIADRIMHEPILTIFKDALDIDILIESNSSSYMAPNPIFDFGGMRYGFNNVTKVHFDRKACVMKGSRLPSAGDLIYVPVIDKLFEITDMDQRDAFSEGGSFYSIPGSIIIYSPSEGTVHMDDEVTSLADSINELAGVSNPAHVLGEVGQPGVDAPTVEQTDAIQRKGANFENDKFDKLNVVRKDGVKNHFDIF